MNKKKDLIWNYASIVIMALGGLLFSVVIDYFYDVEILGVFNRTYSFYIVLSQISSFGLHVAVLKYVSDCRENEKEANEILSTALLMVICISIAVIIACELFIRVIPTTAVRRSAFINILPALLFFSINKVLLNYLNATVQMVPYAVFQGLRNILICLSIIVLSIFRVEGSFLTFSFFMGEFLLFLVMITFLRTRKTALFTPRLDLVKRLILFGIKILPSNIVLELNTKVDLICLGWFVKDESVIGVYSFVSLFAEGFYQVYMVIRRMINPFLHEWYNERTMWDKQYRKLRKISFISALPLSMSIVIVYYLVILIMRKPVYVTGIVPLAIIAVSIGINGLFIVYGNVMSQLGYPGKESIVNLITVGCNFLLNCVLIFLFQSTGAATATALSYCCFSFLIFCFMKKSKNHLSKE